MLGVAFFLALPLPRDAGVAGVMLPLAGLALRRPADGGLDPAARRRDPAARRRRRRRLGRRRRWPHWR